MKWEFKFSIKDENYNTCTHIYEAIKVESEQSERFEREHSDENRVSDAKVYLEGNTLRLILQAEDVPSLRAKVNTWLRLIKVCLDVLEALKASNS